VNGQFVRGGCCILDFYLFWTIDAMRRGSVEEAARYARMLAHGILSLTHPQRELFGEEFRHNN
jgi:hypothetical protein